MLVIHAKEDVGAPESSSGGSGEGSRGSGGGEWMEETLGTQKPLGSHLHGEGVYIYTRGIDFVPHCSGKCKDQSGTVSSR